MNCKDDGLNKPLTRRRLLLGSALLGPLAWWGLSRRPDPDAGKMRVIAVDVGQGDCTLVITPSGRTILVDGGGTSDEAAAGDTDVGAKIVVPFLQFMGIMMPQTGQDLHNCRYLIADCARNWNNA